MSSFIHFQPLAQSADASPISAEPLRTEVRTAFANSLKVIWYTMIGVAGLALLVAAFMRSLPLSTETDEAWGLKEKATESEKIAA